MAASQIAVTEPNADRTNIVIDSKLVARVKRLANVKTTRDAVRVALEHYVRYSSSRAGEPVWLAPPILQEVLQGADSPDRFAGWGL